MPRCSSSLTRRLQRSLPRCIGGAERSDRRAPLADFAGVNRAVAVTAYQSASGLVNLITPTSAVIMGGLALSKVGYDRYLRFVWPFVAAVFVVVCVFVGGAAALS